MRGSLQTPLPTRCIYRQLLREASYLPPLCQPYAKQQIRSRFRKHIHDPVNDAATKARVRRAQHDLRYLWAANHGMIDNVFRILMLTFGRLGRRRRELIKAFLQPEPPADSVELAKQIEEIKQQSQPPPPPQDGTQQQQTKKKLPPDWLDKWDLDKLHALASSQAKWSFWSPKAELKSKKLDPEEDIPKTNTWGRPLPAKLKRSKLRKWYKNLINKIMPPVGRDEWETLRLVASGQADKDLWKMPTRRPLARPLQPGGEAAAAGAAESSDTKVWDWKAYATQAVRHVERGSSRSQKGRTGEEGEAPYGLGKPIGVHDLNRTRLWTRLYAKIWAMTPMMERAPDSESGWNVQWGKIKRQIPYATDAQMVFLEGAEPVKSRSMRGKKAP